MLAPIQSETMATSVPEQVGTNTQVWSNTALRINEIFDKIVWNANTRRNQLLKKLEEIKSAFEAKNRSAENSITELEKLVRSMEETGLRENLAVETLKESHNSNQKEDSIFAVFHFKSHFRIQIFMQL